MLRPVAALSALLLAGAAGSVSAAPRAVPLGAWTWRMTGADFGGFSALELSPDGRHATVVSDHGTIATGTLDRDGDGRVTGASFGPLVRLRGTDGQPLYRPQADSEGLAIAPDGRLYVSFEYINRVFAYAGLTSRAEALPQPRDFAGLPRNESLEALAVDAQGDLWTVPEALPPHGPLRLFRFHDGRWTQPLSLPRGDPFKPVGADFGPDGQLYLLERSFSVLGFRSRIRRFRTDAGPTPAGETLVETPRGTYDNLEGLAVWRDGQGRNRLTAISDDNFSALEVTQFVDFAVQE